MPAATFDSLEARRLFAAVPTFDKGSISTTTTVTYAIPRAADTSLVGSTLYVTGIDDASQIKANMADGKIWFTDSFATTLETTAVYDAKTNAFVPSLDVNSLIVGIKKYEAASVRKVVVVGTDGTDSIDLSALTVPAEVHAGHGRDTVTGGAGNDTLYGEGGDDILNGGRGTDILVGGSGDDLLTARRGPDTLLGGAGDDRLYAYVRKAVLSGNAGQDIGLLRYAPDAIAGVEVTSSKSPLMVTPTSQAPLGTTATLGRSGNGLGLTVSSTLPTGGWGVDFDLARSSRTDVAVNATFYAPNTGVGQALTAYSETFALGGNLARRFVNVKVNSGGENVLSGKTYVTPAFDAKRFVVGEYNADDTLSPVEL